MLLLLDKSIKPYRQIGGEDESDHGSDNETELVLTKKKRGKGKKKEDIRDNEAATTALAAKERQPLTKKRKNPIGKCYL